VHISRQTRPYLFPQYLCCLSRRCGHTPWPGGRSKSAATGAGKPNLLLDGYKRHLKNGEARNDWSKIALVHWHPDVVHWSFKSAEIKKLPRYVTRQLGEQVGLTDADFAIHPSATNLAVREASYFYNLPNISLSRAEDYVEVKAAELGLEASVGKRGNVSSEKKRAVLQQSLEEQQEEEEARQKKKIDAKLHEHAQFILGMSQSKLDYLEKLDSKWKTEARQKDNELEQLRLQNKLLNDTITAFDDFKISSPDTTPSCSGLTRFNLLSPEWHLQNPTQCKDLFGFTTYVELKGYVRCFWSMFNDPITMGPAKDSKEKMTDYEKCLVTLMRFHRRVTLTHLAGIWGRGSSRIGEYIYEWAPRWGKMGRFLSILDVTEELLKACVPKEFKDMKMEMVAMLVDGKVIMTEVCRGHSAVKRGMWNDKTHHDGVLVHAWIIPYGLSVEHTPLYLGRVTEQALVELWGLGNKYVFESVRL
jgi:hypothetical protein